MDPTTYRLALPDDQSLLARLITALAGQEDPPITVNRAPTTVVTFRCSTWEPILRSRVMEALEAAVGPDWQRVVTPVD